MAVLDMSQAKEKPQFTIFDDGQTLLLTCVAVNEKYNANQKKYLRLEFQIQAPAQFKGGKYVETMYMTDSALPYTIGNIKAAMASIGVNLSLTNFDTNAMIGKTFKVVLKKELDQNGNGRNSIKEWCKKTQQAQVQQPVQMPQTPVQQVMQQQASVPNNFETEDIPF